MTISIIILVSLLGYLIGSIPNAYLVTLAVKRINIFEVGSGNMGGTNVARTLGLHWGIFTSCLDIAKGLVAVLIAQQIVPPTESLIPSMFAAIAAVAGHNWSIIATGLYAYYQKKFELLGGKGAATAFGTMLALLPPFPIVMLLVIGITLAFLTRYASLSVLVSFAAALIWTFAWSLVNVDISNIYLVYTILIAILIVWRFRENIQQLMDGTERKLGERIQSTQ